ncbi:unnamed protein product [Effrenium voratum]|nr:unnamed protein product [Effrenium voratum]
MAIQSALSERFAAVDAELRRTFADLQAEVQRLHVGIEDDILRHMAVDESPQNGDTHSSEAEVLDTWLLEGAVPMPVEDPAGVPGRATVAAVVLQETAEIEKEEGGGLANLTLRLNSHLMELSMKATEAVGSGGRERFKNTWEVTKIRSSNSKAQTQFDKCDSAVIPPNSKFRIFWDLFGAWLILADAFVLPLCIAWNLTMTPFPAPNSKSHAILHIFAAVSGLFWPVDVYLNFRTAFYEQGNLVTSRKAIVVRYVKTWFLFDLSVVSIDILAGCFTLLDSEEQGQEFLQSLRSARYLRILRTLRILRILKAGKINILLENFVIAMGRQWLIVFFTVGRMLMAIGLVAHLLACLWFGLGQAVSESSGGKSWIDMAGITQQPGMVQYVHAFGWILLPPAPPQLEPESGLEHLFALIVFVTTVLVIGSALSILTGTLHEIRQVNNERSRKRRELRIFLQTKAVPTELLMRIMSYADYKMARQSPIGYDVALISPMLHAELATFQFGGNLQEHPLFQLTEKFFPNIFADFCSALQKQFFSEAESVFSAGSLAEMMYITSHGSFAIGDSDGSVLMRPGGEHNYFAEVALYVEAVMHSCTLIAESFAEVFVLSGANLAGVLANSPMCTTMFIEYAYEYIRLYTEASRDMSISEVPEMESSCARNATLCNSFYLDMNVDPRKVLRYMDLTDLQDEQQMPGKFVSDFLGSNEPLAELLPKLRGSFVELNETDGLHSRFGEPKEQERVESGILSMLALSRGDYEAFTAPQGAANRLTSAQWQQLRDVWAWAEPSAEKLHAAIWLLAVRPIGKYRSAIKQLPSYHQRPEQAVRFILVNHPRALPSGTDLPEDVLNLVTATLSLQLNFNFAQMLQGENVPANLLQLKEFILNNDGEATLKFYVLFLLGFLSGLAGGRGSRFMTNSNARATLPGLAVLKRVLEKDPTALYWTYIHHRGLELGRRPQNTTDLAVVRLACLCRAQKPQDLQGLQEAWQGLGQVEHRELLRHFLADGVQNQAVILEFLPLCLERAKANAFVGIPALLKVLVELLGAVRALVQKGKHRDDAKGSSRTVPVDLADFAAFILMVQNSYIFQSCLCRSKLRLKAGRMLLEVSQENWRRVRDPQTDVIMLANSVRDLLDKQQEEDRSVQSSTPLHQPTIQSCQF